MLIATKTYELKARVWLIKLRVANFAICGKRITNCCIEYTVFI